MMVGQWHNEDKKHQVLFSVLSPRVFGASCRCLVVAKYYVEIYHPSQILVLMAQKSETSAVSQSSKDLTHAADLDDVCLDGQVGPDRQQPPPPPGAWWPHRWVTCNMSPPCVVTAPPLHDSQHQQSLSWIFYSKSAWQPSKAAGAAQN